MDCKRHVIPMETGLKFLKHDGTDFVDNGPYKQLVGTRESYFLTNTRLDIFFAICSGKIYDNTKAFTLVSI
jgi:hypothetical protein